MTSIKVLSRRRPRKSLFTSPTLLKSLSGNAELADTDRYCLVMRAKRGNCGFVIKESPIACVDDHLVLHSCCNMPPIACVDDHLVLYSYCNMPPMTCVDDHLVLYSCYNMPRPSPCSSSSLSSSSSASSHHIHCRLVPPECRLLYCQVPSWNSAHS